MAEKVSIDASLYHNVTKPDGYVIHTKKKEQSMTTPSAPTLQNNHQAYRQAP